MSEIVTASFKSGSYIIVEGAESDNTFFIIKKGKVQLNRTLDIPDLAKRTLSTGDFFEVESALSKKRRLSTAIALTDCEIHIIPFEMFDTLISRQPSLVQKIIISFSQRMRNLDHYLTQINYKEISEITSDKLFAVGSYYSANNQHTLAAFAFHNFVKENPSDSRVAEAKKNLERLKELIPEHSKLEEEIANINRTVPQGSMIFSEGMQGNAMYLIQSGEVRICKIAYDKEILLAKLVKGDIFGEMALIENKLRSASAISDSECNLLVINHDTFPLIIKRQQKLITRITSVLAGRIWFVSRQIENAMLPPGLPRIYDALVFMLEHKGIGTDYDKTDVIDMELTTDELFKFTGLNKKEGINSLKQLVELDEILIKGDNILLKRPKHIHSRSLYFKHLDKVKKKKDRAK